MARSVGSQVNSETTSKDTKVSSFAIICDLMNSTNALEFLTWELVRPSNGASNRARNLESSYVGEDTKDTMGCRGTSSLEKDPTTSLESKMNARLLQLKKCGRLPSDVYSRLRSSAGRVPLLYGLPKVHKPEVPLQCPLCPRLHMNFSSSWHGY